MMARSFLGVIKDRVRSIIKLCTKPAKSPLLQVIDERALSSNNTLYRLGTKYGGWLLPLNVNLNEESICYLAGAGEDISFDCALVEKFGVKARIVDPTPRAISHFEKLRESIQAGKKFPINGSSTDFYSISERLLARISFLPYGLAGKDMQMKFYFPKDPSHVSCSVMNLQNTDEYFEANCYRLSSLMRTQGDSSIDLLKMDIEGGEYDVLDDLIESRLLPSLLLVEFDEAHTPLHGDAMMRISDRVRRLEDLNMICIAVDGCNATFQYQPK